MEGQGASEREREGGAGGRGGVVRWLVLLGWSLGRSCFEVTVSRYCQAASVPPPPLSWPLPHLPPLGRAEGSAREKAH